MPGPWENADGELIVDSSGNPIECEDCPCGECDCNTDGPVADFVAVNDTMTPCVYDFTDASAAGACGSIVSWEWDFGDGGTSTLQNPSHTFASAGGHLVTLTVTDSQGCTDTYQELVGCCEWCGDGAGVPAEVTVTIAGPLTDGIFNCDPGPAAGTHAIPFVSFIGACGLKYLLALDSTVPALATPCQISILVNLPDPITGADVYITPTGAALGATAHYQETGDLCGGTLTLDLVSSAGSYAGPATITLSLGGP